MTRQTGGKERHRSRLPGHRTLFRLATLLATIPLIKGCGDGDAPTEPPPPEPPRATTITVSPATADLAALGATVQLSAQVQDQNGQGMAGAAVTWASAAAAVAAVSTSGLVTAVANGSATITATSGSASGSAAVTVAQAVSSVAVTPETASLGALGDTVRLSAEAFDANGHAVAGTDFSWESSDESVVAVDASGLVTAVANGTATVTAASGAASGSAAVTVAQAVSSVAVTPDTASLGALGDTVRLSAEAFDANGHAVAGAEFSWESSDEGVATVDGSGLVTAVGNGQATITAAVGDALGQSAITVAANRAPMAVDSIPPHVVVPRGEASVDVTPYFSDPDGDALSYAAASSAPEVAAAAVSGAEVTVTGVSAGTATITVTASDPDGLSAQQAFQATVRQAGFSITAVEPTVLIEGDEATITGSGFSSTITNNLVTIDGLPARVVSASRTNLVIGVPVADCRPPRRAELRVSVGSRSDSLTVGVAPLAQEDMALPQYSYIHTRAGDGCVHLPGSASGGEYLIGVVSTSERPASLTSVTLNGTPGDLTVAGTAATASASARAELRRMPARPLADNPSQPAAPAPRVPDSPFLVRDDSLRVRRASANNEVMARNAAWLRELGRASPPAPGADGQHRGLEAGDTTSVYEPSSNNWGCSAGGRRIDAVVRLVGSHTIWLEDLDNPSGTFSNSELVDLDALYAAHIASVLDDYFGGLSDVDGNGRILILMTQEVNRSQGAGGYVFLPDLWPTDRCAASNRAEILYGWVPDPDGVVGPATSKERVFADYPSLIAHEAAHIAQHRARALGNAGEKKSWELEGGAVLAEQLVAYRLFGHASGQNLGYAEFSAGAHWQSGWFWDMARFFGWDPDKSGGRVPHAPEQCTWIGRPREGNSGPCRHPQTAVYGVPSMVFRYALDRWGGAYPGGEEALMRRLTQSPTQGFASLRDVSAWRTEAILADFYITLWLDLQPGLHARGMTSWNLHDIFDRFPETTWLQPRPSTSRTPTASARVRAGSSLYVHWTPGGSLDPTSIKVTAGGGGPVPGHISVWALRIR